MPADPSAALPAEAEGRLKSSAFSSGLSVNDFAACLQMGMRPVGLVQGFAVMSWSRLGPVLNSAMSTGAYVGGTNLHQYRCPHFGGYGGMVGEDHRLWGANMEQVYVSEAWAAGFNAAYTRMVAEAADAGAHAVIGVVDAVSSLIDSSVREFHMYGTAVVIEGAEKPDQPWTTYLAGQRLMKLLEAGFMPVSVVGALSSVRMWAVCVTQACMGGRLSRMASYQSSGSIDQLSDAQLDVRHLARDMVKRVLGTDTLHGAAMVTEADEVGEGDVMFSCSLKGTRVRRYKAADPLATPLAMVGMG